MEASNKGVVVYDLTTAAILRTRSSTADTMCRIQAGCLDEGVSVMLSVIAVKHKVNFGIGYVPLIVINLPSPRLKIDRMAWDHGSAVFHALLEIVNIFPGKNRCSMPFSQSILNVSA